MSMEKYFLSLKIFDFELKHGLPKSQFTENLEIGDAKDSNFDEPTQDEYLMSTSVNSGQSDETF